MKYWAQLGPHCPFSQKGEFFDKLKCYSSLNLNVIICPFESGQCGKEGKKLQFEYLENKKSFFDEIKNIFHSF